MSWAHSAAARWAAGTSSSQGNAALMSRSATAMSVLPWTTQAPACSRVRMRASTSAGRGPFMTRSPVTATASGRARSTAASAASRAATLPWMSPKTARRKLTAGPPRRG